jgi:hypothetical protein
MKACVAAPAFHLQDRHPASHRYAILEDNGTTLWLYLTAPDEPTVVAETWIFNHDEPIQSQEWPLFQHGRAMFPPEELSPVEVVFDRPEVHSWTFDWSADGEAVAVFCDAQPIAMVQSTRRLGFSRHVIRAGPWGVPWCARTFHSLFGMGEGE